MQVKLKVQVRVPFENTYLPKDTVLEVLEIRGTYYFCSCMQKDIYSIPIQKELVEVVEE